jgi:glycosyltransferase involved in cell wall biosynthesis
MTSARRILYIQYTNPAGYPPLEHSSRLLADAGWQVVFLGTGAAGSGNLRFPPHPNIRVWRMPFCPAGWRQKVHYGRFLLWALVWVLWWRPQWIYASDLLSCPVAWLLSFMPGHRVVYHEHDSPHPNVKSRFQRWCLAARRRLARRAAVCVLPNAVRAQRFTEQTDAPNVRCVWNCPTSDEVGPPRQRGDGEDIWLLYHGSITPPQLPSALLDALARLPERVKLRVVGYETVGHRNYANELREKGKRLGIANRLEFLGTIPTRGEMLNWCGRSDVGLALFAKQGLQPMPGASNKPFDYLARGCALLVSDLPDWREMYVEPGCARACVPDDPESIAGAVRWFLEHPEQMRAMGETGRRRILEDWNYEAQFRPVWQALNGGEAMTALSP